MSFTRLSYFCSVWRELPACWFASGLPRVERRVQAPFACPPRLAALACLDSNKQTSQEREATRSSRVWYGCGQGPSARPAPPWPQEVSGGGPLPGRTLLRVDHWVTLASVLPHPPSRTLRSGVQRKACGAAAPQEHLGAEGSPLPRRRPAGDPQQWPASRLRVGEDLAGSEGLASCRGLHSLPGEPASMPQAGGRLPARFPGGRGAHTARGSCTAAA